jgi:hypothetical protein
MNRKTPGDPPQSPRALSLVMREGTRAAFIARLARAVNGAVPSRRALAGAADEPI